MATALREDSWAGVIDATPDSTPVVDTVDGVEGLGVITGFSGNGLSQATGAGEMIAQIMTGETPTCNPAVYRLTRFSESGKLTFRH